MYASRFPHIPGIDSPIGNPSEIFGTATKIGIPYTDLERESGLLGVTYDRRSAKH